MEAKTSFLQGVVEPPEKEYFVDFGDQQGLPRNPFLRRVAGEVIPGYRGTSLLYHPDPARPIQDCIDGTHTWIHNEYGYLDEVILEADGDKFKLLKGSRRPDIESHNTLDKTERHRRRLDQSGTLPIPPDSDDKDANDCAPSPVSPDKKDDESTEEDHLIDPTNDTIQHSPIKKIDTPILD
jgi:hypothetical protein